MVSVLRWPGDITNGYYDNRLQEENKFSHQDIRKIMLLQYSIDIFNKT